MRKFAIGIKLDGVIGGIRWLRQVAVREGAAIAHHHAAWKPLLVVAQELASALSPEAHRLRDRVFPIPEDVPDDAARDKNSVVGRALEKLVRIFIVLLDATILPVPIRHEIVRWVDVIHAVSEYEPHWPLTPLW